MGIDISVGESLDEVADLLERAAAPFQDLTWDRIFPMPTAGALAGALAVSGAPSRAAYDAWCRFRFGANTRGA